MDGKYISIQDQLNSIEVPLIITSSHADMFCVSLIGNFKKGGPGVVVEPTVCRVVYNAS